TWIATTASSRSGTTVLSRSPGWTTSSTAAPRARCAEPPARVPDGRRIGRAVPALGRLPAPATWPREAPFPLAGSRLSGDRSLRLRAAVGGVLAGFFIVWAMLGVGWVVGRSGVLGPHGRYVLNRSTFFVA